MAATPNQPPVRPHANGLLPVTSIHTTSINKATKSKANGPRLKVVVRRLAPGLTESEFTSTLGDEWKVGQGRVDWFVYKVGKDSRDPTKLSRPSRAYMHLTSDVHLIPLSETVRALKFDDTHNTSNSSALPGPPTVEFAPYGRVPSGKVRVDQRHGTIDQDPEFMDFLEGLINPSNMREDLDPNDEVPILSKDQKITTTPLVQYLKDKKANKAKEAAMTKAAKQAKLDASNTKPSKANIEISNTGDEAKKTVKDTKKEKVNNKVVQEAVKVLSRENVKTVPAPNQTASPAVAAKPARSSIRERGSVAAAARILQRDLGLSPGNAHRKAKADADVAAKADAVNKGSTTHSATAESSSPKSTISPHGGRRVGRGSTAPLSDRPQNAMNPNAAQLLSTNTQENPITLLKKTLEKPLVTTPLSIASPSTISKPAMNSNASSSPLPRRQPPLPVPSASATRAFVKHANPSQGVTEALLREAMETFGAVSFVDIDKRKGFAYVDFVEAEGLAKAMAANPTKIAQGTVQVLERKDVKPAREPPSGPARGGPAFSGRGGRGIGLSTRRGRGGGSSSGGGRAASASGAVDDTGIATPVVPAPANVATGTRNEP